MDGRHGSDETDEGQGREEDVVEKGLHDEIVGKVEVENARVERSVWWRESVVEKTRSGGDRYTGRGAEGRGPSVRLDQIIERK